MTFSMTIDSWFIALHFAIREQELRTGINIHNWDSCYEFTLAKLMETKRIAEDNR